MAFSQNHEIPQEPEKETVRILFVGNSLTYTNNLPKLVKKTARQTAGVKVYTEMIAKPNYALEDHLNEGALQAKINSGNFDFVIVQQGPSSQDIGKIMLDESTEKISGICTSNNSRLCLFMVWPSLDHYVNFDRVIDNYRSASEKAGAILCPVGEVWKAHFDQSNSFDYYGPDRFHPSLKGSLVAAEVIVGSLFEQKRN